MRTPDSVLEELLGKVRIISVRNKEIDLLQEVKIPDGCDLDELLHEQVEKSLLWKLTRSRALAVLDRLRDELDELKNRKYGQFWQAHEDKEREELAHAMYDEDAPKDPFRRRKVIEKHVASGVSKNLGRWRRNFTDDYIWAHVWIDENVLEKKLEVNAARKQVEILTAVTEVMDYRMRCISHLCARDRNPTA